MSKYIKLEDAISVCREKQIIKGDAVTGIRYPRPDEIINNLSDLPTIEVSEDCISREYLEEQLQQIEDITAMAHIDLGEDPYDETEEITMPISTVRKIFKNAPSVVPRLDKEDLEDIYEHISESYVEGYMDGQADGVNAIGDCNICRFAGCSECDDCINGSQWVRMTKGDEE